MSTKEYTAATYLAHHISSRMSSIAADVGREPRSVIMLLCGRWLGMIDIKELALSQAS